MEQRLIDANAIKLEKGFFEKVDNVPKFYEWLGKQPTVDAVQVVHSSWSVFAEMDLREGRTGKHILVCRECGHTEKIHHSDKMPNYCQNCGAKMDGGKADKEWFCAEGERKDGDRK